MSEISSKEHLSKELIECLEKNDIDRGLSLAQELNKAYPDYAQGWFLASCALRPVNKLHAIIAIDKALKLDTLNAHYKVHKAKCYLDLNESEQAVTVLSTLAPDSLRSASLCAEVGLILCALRSYTQALDVFKRAVEIESDNYQHHYNLATAYRFLGENRLAEQELDIVLSLNPSDCEAQHLRSNLRTQTASNNHIAELKLASSRPALKPIDTVNLNYALAKEYEDLGENEQSFLHLKTAADMRRQNIDYEIGKDLEIIDAIKRVYSADLYDGHIGGCNDAAPIFILGMPRTGTTLIERMLGSHSLVCSAGEINNFAMAMMDQVKSCGISAASQTELIQKPPTLDFESLGNAYLTSVRPLRDASPHFIDKLPFNYLYIGLIHLALPKAKIIHVQRHAMDTCYAIYKQLFQDAYPFSYDLNELGQYYIAYERLMRHWNTVIPDIIHTVHYEDMVKNTETEARKLLDYSGLAWEDQCLRFYENQQPSTTASTVQVRQPVYASSVGKWHQYQQQLEPLHNLLKNSGIDVDC